MKFFILLCLASLVFANVEEESQDIAKAKHALDQLTFSKEEYIYNIGDNEDEGADKNEVNDPCLDFSCRPGMECAVDSNGPFCQCASSCPLPEESDDELHRIQVCTTLNTTYPNLCEFHRQKCLDQALDRVLVDYYGGCTVIPPCHPQDLAEYPVRMTEWFMESLHYLQTRTEDHGGLTKRERVVLKEPRKPEAQAIFWKFRRLDKHPADLYLDFAELEPLRAPISLMEPCTQPFLALCDADHDNQIDVLEFGRCLNLEEADMEY